MDGSDGLATLFSDNCEHTIPSNNWHKSSQFTLWKMTPNDQALVNALVSHGHKCRTISEDGCVFFCARDVGEIIKLKNYHTTICNYPAEEKRSFVTPTNGGAQRMTFITSAGLKRLLSSSRSSWALTLASNLGFDTKSYIAPCVESCTIKCIQEVFEGEKMLVQHQVGKFKIDLYFPEHAIAVECDEHHHSQRCGADIARQEYLETRLRCDFIRYRPYEPNFNIFSVINMIFVKMKEMQRV